MKQNKLLKVFECLMFRACAEHGDQVPYLSGGQAEMFIGALRRPGEQSKRDQRTMLARNDMTLEIFRHNKVQLRMQLLTGTRQERRRILRAAFVVCLPHSSHMLSV